LRTLFNHQVSKDNKNVEEKLNKKNKQIPYL